MFLPKKVRELIFSQSSDNQNPENVDDADSNKIINGVNGIRVRDKDKDNGSKLSNGQNNHRSPSNGITQFGSNDYENGDESTDAIDMEEEDEEDSSLNETHSSCGENDSASSMANGGPTICRDRGVGTITAMPDGFQGEVGLVERFYRFNPKDFQHSGVRFKLGDKVEYTAEQNTNEGFYYKIVEMKHYQSEEQKQYQDKLDYRTEVCEIKNFIEETHDAEVESKNLVRYIIKADLLPKDYESELGDWLIVKMKIQQLNEDNSCTNKILSVEPLRRKEFERGRLRRMENRYYNQADRTYSRQVVWLAECSTEIRILVPDKLISRSSEFKHESNVFVEAIESTQGNFNWRAIVLEPTTNRRYRGDIDENVNASGKAVTDYLNNLMSNKGGIIISDRIEFGEIRIGCSKEKIITIKNTTSSETHYLKKVDLQYDQSVAKFEINLPKSESGDIIAVIEPQKSINISVRASPLLLGKTSEHIVFKFDQFKIGRKLSMLAAPNKDETLQQLTINQREGHHRRRRNERQVEYNKLADRRRCDNVRERVRGCLAVRKEFFSAKRFLPHYQIPQKVAEAYKEQLADKLFEELPTLKFDKETLDKNKWVYPMTIENYKDCFHAGLWMEEIEHINQIEKLTTEGIRLFRTNDDVMYFAMPFLEFGQIQPGNLITVFNEAEPTSKTYDSQIVRISDKHVYARFDQELYRDYKDELMTVKFRIPRTTYRRWHYAIENAMKMLGKEWLFPETVIVRPPRFTIIENDGDDDDDEEDSDFSDAMTHVDHYDKANVSDAKNQLNTSSPIKVIEKEVAEASPIINENDSRLVKIPLGKSKFRKLQKAKNELDVRCTSIYPREIKKITAIAREDMIEQEVKLKWFNKQLNPEQKEAVRRILKGQCRPLPFIIYGPPGTGKTVTMIEAIMQVHKLFKNSRILVTAPANAAADLIAEYLVETGEYAPGDFIRLLGFSRSTSSVPKKIEQYCEDPGSLQSILKCGIIITTTNTAGVLFEAEIAEDNFSHVFIDEAGCCFEPDGMIPALFVNTGKQGQLIMAGDHKQLGPLVLSRTAKYYGLGVSFLERLMSTPLYSSSTENDILVTKLVKNYRSHELILKLPSKQFYGGQLEFKSPKEEGEQLLAKVGNYLPAPGVPLLFHGVQAIESQDTDSFSWYNTSEVVTVVDKIRELLSCGCTPGDIGVIAPYKKQVDKIRQAIELELKCEMPKIGCVEAFQGDERKIIIISLVRTFDTDERTAFPLAKLAFVFSEKRINVMLTRARCLQIVIGNPYLYCNNELWLEYILYCKSLGAYTGCELPVEYNDDLKQFYAYEKAEDEQEIIRHRPLPNRQLYVEENYDE